MPPTERTRTNEAMVSVPPSVPATLNVSSNITMSPFIRGFQDHMTSWMSNLIKSAGWMHAHGRPTIQHGPPAPRAVRERRCHKDSKTRLPGQRSRAIPLRAVGRARTPNWITLGRSVTNHFVHRGRQEDSRDARSHGHVVQGPVERSGSDPDHARVQQRSGPTTARQPSLQ